MKIKNNKPDEIFNKNFQKNLKVKQTENFNEN